ncbi:MAG: hypothetical protein Q7U89_06435 [Coriobacteriia bacterium]|nr:hypothetical protein [Coriobacteriia bacterium]
MNREEAEAVLNDQLSKSRARGYEGFLALLGEPDVLTVSGPSGREYQVEVEAFWDVGPEGDIRVVGMIDDGGWRSFVPLTSSFIMRPDGTTVG